MKHNFIERKTKHENVIIHVCSRCGATKNYLNENFKCVENVDSKNRIENYLLP